MRILVPYLNLDPQTQETLEKYAGDTEIEYIKTPVDEPYAYWRALQERWGGDDLVVIEQDIIINADVLPAFRDCDHGWCTFAYPLYDYGEWMYWCLGCVRYSAAIQQQYPMIPFTIWFRLDTAIRDMFWRGRVWPHTHGTVAHLHADRPDTDPRKNDASNTPA